MTIIYSDVYTVFQKGAAFLGTIVMRCFDTGGVF